MTCIISFERDNKIIIAGDKKASNSATGSNVKEPKIFEKKKFMIGYTSSFRMGQILKHIWTPPSKKEDQTIDNYLYTDVINSLRQVFEVNNFGESDTTGTFILVYKNRKFIYQSDNSLLEYEDNVISTGSGEEIAFGSVKALIDIKTLSIKEILTKTFKIISNICLSVSKEYDCIIKDIK